MQTTSISGMNVRAHSFKVGRKRFLSSGRGPFSLSYTHITSTPPFFLYILQYIHLNPLDYLKGFENWRERSKGHIPNAREALKYLETYRWSSYLDYAGKKNFPSLITKDFFEDRPDEYAVDLRDYLRSTVEPHQDFAKLWLE